MTTRTTHRRPASAFATSGEPTRSDLRSCDEGEPTSSAADSDEPSNEEARLLEAARRGDGTALEELYVRYHQRALRTSAFFATFDYPAEDLAADAITRMLQALARGGGPTSTVNGYLSMTIRNLAASASRRRSHQAHPRFVDPDQLRDVALRTDDQDNPARAVLAAETRRELGISLAMVNPRARSVLALLYLESMSVQECAQHFGITPEAVRSLAYRARTALRRAMDPPAVPSLRTASRTSYSCVFHTSPRDLLPESAHLAPQSQTPREDTILTAAPQAAAR